MTLHYLFAFGPLFLFGADLFGMPLDVCEVTFAREGGVEIILVVDDEESLREILSLQLRSRGYFPVIAETIGEADEILKQIGTVHAALIDWHIKGKDGKVLADSLRAGHKIPCALMSGEFLGAHDIEGYLTLSKPFSPEMLDKVLRELLPPKATP